MNQILFVPINNRKKKFILFLKLYSALSTLIVLSFTSYYFYRLFNISRNERISDVLISSYDISRLYSTISKNLDFNQVHIESDEDTFSIIGILQIDKIDLRYPILSNINDYLLSVAPCRFHGPLPNQVR